MLQPVNLIYFIITLVCFLFLNQCTNIELEGLEKETQLLIIFRCKLDLASDCAIDSIQPDAIAGLQLWLKADSFSSRIDGSVVSGWPDSSGQGNDAIQGTTGTTANRPKYYSNQLNGMPGLQFDGTDDFFIYDGDFFINSSYSVFIVIKITNNQISNYILGGSATGSVDINLHFGVESALTNFQLAHYADDLLITGNVVDTNGEFYSGNFDTSSSARSIYKNGMLLGADTGTALISNAGSAIGRYLTFYFRGSVFEVIVYNNNISDSNRKGLECYLSKKYGISVSQACG